MGKRLIIDTNVLIEFERRDRSVWDGFDDDDELAIAAVTRAELLIGGLLAPNERVAAVRRDQITRTLALVQLLDYTERTADHHARLVAHTKRTGRPRGAHDLIIAAHAAETRRAVATRDANARFGDLPGVRVVDL
ncbi:MAG: type II toxin-antitoxin system VapC family toxin [Pseudoclavibacter sp.]